MPDFSIHIVTYNSADALARCIEGVRQQQGVTFDLRIFDNASSDSTRQIARDLGVELVESSENLGYAAAHNRLIEEANGRYILTLNPDVYLLPGYLGAMREALDADPQVGATAGCLLRIPAVREQPIQIDSIGLYMRRNRRQGLRGDGQPVAIAPSLPLPIFGPDGAAAVYRREMLQDIAVHGEIFDEDFFMHKEDIDVCWRAQLRGWKALYVPTAIAHHVRTFRPGQRRRVDSFLQVLGLRNRYLLMLKNESAAHFLRDLLPILVYDLGILGYVLLRERSSLRAYSSAWSLVGRMRMKRGVIQEQRTVDWRTLRQWFTR